MKKSRYYPKVNLIVDQRMDMGNGVYFIEYTKEVQFRRWFLPEELDYLIDKNVPMAEQKNIVRAYVKETYALHGKEIERGTAMVKKNWKKVEKEFFKLADDIFAGHPWSKGNYGGIATVFGMYPRWIDKKRFFFPYIHKIEKYADCVIAHEMLHFIFFDYIKKYYKLYEYSKIKGKEDDYIWKVSETFNSVMENTTLKSIVGRKTKPYPGQEQMFRTMLAQWKKKQDIKWLLDQWLK